MLVGEEANAVISGAAVTAFPLDDTPPLQPIKKTSITLSIDVISDLKKKRLVSVLLRCMRSPLFDCGELVAVYGKAKVHGMDGSCSPAASKRHGNGLRSCRCHQRRS